MAGYVQKSKYSKDTNKNNLVLDVQHLVEFTEELESMIGGQNQFAELEDVNVTYAGNAGKVIAINGAENGVEAIDVVVPTLTSELTNDSGFITSNIATNNLLFDQNSAVDLEGFDLTFNDGDIRFNTLVGLNTNPAVNTRINIMETTLRGITIETQDEEALNVFSSLNRGIISGSTSNYGGQFTSTNNYAVQLIGANGLRYTSEGSAGRNGILIYQSDGTTILFNVTNDNRIKSDSLAPLDFVNDALASAGGVEVNQFYHTAGVVKLRLT